MAIDDSIKELVTAFESSFDQLSKDDEKSEALRGFIYSSKDLIQVALNAGEDISGAVEATTTAVSRIVEKGDL